MIAHAPSHRHPEARVWWSVRRSVVVRRAAGRTTQRIGGASSFVQDIGAERISHRRSAGYFEIKDGDTLALRSDRRPAYASDWTLMAAGFVTKSAFGF
jgi:hypothetical protein